MPGPGLETSVVDWVIDCPESEFVFRAYGVDYHCEGKSLEYACRQAGASPEEVLAEIRRLVEQKRPPVEE